MRNNRGFTLIEIIAVLAILSVLVIIAIPKFIKVDDRAEEVALEMGVQELNGREKMIWTNEKIGFDRSEEDFDIPVWTRMTLNLDIGYKYDLTGTDSSGGNLRFGSRSVSLERKPATLKHPGIWGGTDSKGRKYGWHKNPNNPHYIE